MSHTSWLNTKFFLRGFVTVDRPFEFSHLDTYFGKKETLWGKTANFFIVIYSEETIFIFCYFWVTSKLIFASVKNLGLSIRYSHTGNVLHVSCINNLKLWRVLFIKENRIALKWLTVLFFYTECKIFLFLNSDIFNWFWILSLFSFQVAPPFRYLRFHYTSEAGLLHFFHLFIPRSSPGSL